MNRKKLGTAIIILGTLSAVLFFVAGNSIGSTGQIMAQIQSQAGNTVAEAYYQNVGELAVGISIFMYALGVTVITSSIGYGGELLLPRDNNEDNTVNKRIRNNYDELPEL